MKLRKLIGVLLCLALVMGLAACSSNDASGGETEQKEESAAQNETNASDDKTADTGETEGAEDELLIGLTASAYPPYCYLDENDEFQGFEVEVMKEIDRRLDGYTIQISTLPWEAMFEALDSDQAQFMADQVTITDERLEKYNFSIPYYETRSNICVKKGRTDIQSMEDLEGKTVWAPIGESHTVFLEAYNAEHNDAINLHYVETAGSVWEDGLIEIQSGRVDALLNEPVMLNTTINERGLDCEIVGDAVAAETIGICFAKSEKGDLLKEKFDAILQEMLDDGTMAELSMQFMGDDYTPR